MWDRPIYTSVILIITTSPAERLRNGCPRTNRRTPSSRNFLAHPHRSGTRQTHCLRRPEVSQPALTAEERAADLLPRLTLQEKVAQISGGWEARADVLDTTGTYTTEQARAIFNRWWHPSPRWRS
jgi:hypothetical protein